MIAIKDIGGSIVRRSKRERAGETRRRQTGEQGFTLVEMLVVITIIGLIMGLIGPRVLNYLSESKVKAAKIQLQSFGGALDLFYLDAGRFPSTAEGLTALVRPTPGVAEFMGHLVEAALHGVRQHGREVCVQSRHAVGVIGDPHDACVACGPVTLGDPDFPHLFRDARQHRT